LGTCASGTALQSAIARALSVHVPSGSLAIALSAGPDSAAMAVCASAVCQAQGRSLFLLHVHHGLQPDADKWQKRAVKLGDLLQRPVITERVTVDLTQGQGLEAAARQARYASLQRMAKDCRCDAVLLAHHQQDQAETVLIRLFRGAGVMGVAAMATAEQQSGILWLRPWLDVSRTEILQYMQEFTESTGWRSVEDPSNTDGDLSRAVLRSQVISGVQSHWPAWSQTLSRHAKQAAQAQRLLSRYGQSLVARIRSSANMGVDALASSAKELAPELDLRAWRSLDEDEQYLVLRVWIEQAGAQLPTQRRLDELVRQLRQLHALGHDRQLLWQQKDCEVTCTKGQLRLRVKI
jgi:tRNA(Ile)-lysidine synthase